jgi:hypothetical protein
MPKSRFIANSNFAELNQALARYPVNPLKFRMEQAEVSPMKAWLELS